MQAPALSRSAENKNARSQAPFKPGFLSGGSDRPKAKAVGTRAGVGSGVGGAAGANGASEAAKSSHGPTRRLQEVQGRPVNGPTDAKLDQVGSLSPVHVCTS